MLDVSSYVSGPFAAEMLADLGASVIKVEPVGGDPLVRWGRAVDGWGIVYTNCNRGKQVTSLDLQSDPGRAQFLSLASEADVVITNWRTGVADRLGLVEGLADCPDLIWARITGWGNGGPLAGVPAFDSSIQVRSGLAWAQGDEAPKLMRMFLADKITALLTAQAVVAALYQRARGGGAGVIDIAMIDALAYFNFPDLLQNRSPLDAGILPARNEQMEANRPAQTADGWMVVSPVGGRQLKAALEAIDRLDALADMKQATSQHEMTALFVSLLDGALPARPTGDWLEIFETYDVPAAPVLTIDEHLNDAQVAYNGTYDIIDGPGTGRFRRARYPARFGDDPVRGSAIPPRRVSPETVRWPLG